MKFIDEIKLYFRKPFRIILLILSSVIITFALLFFIMSFLVARKNLDSIKDNYSQISTVINLQNKAGVLPEYASINEDILDLLKNSKYIDKIEIRDTMAGQITNKNNLNSYFASIPTNTVAILKGVIDKINNKEASEGGVVIEASLTIKKILAAKAGWLKEGSPINISIFSNGDRLKELKTDKEYIFIVGPYINSEGLMNNSISAYMLDDDVFGNLTSSKYSSYISSHGISEDIDNDFVDFVKEEIQNQNNLYNIRLVDDMNMIIPVANENMIISQGRFIGEEDFGKNICLVSDKIAFKHNLNLGDIINIKLSDKVYNNNGYISAFPNLLEKGSYDFSSGKDYTIVGIYMYPILNYYQSPMIFSYNDIFIPKFNNELNCDYISANNFSFKIKVDDIEEFEKEDLPKIEKMGYKMVSSVSNWQKVESSVDSIKKAIKKNSIYSLTIGVVGIVIIIFINIINNKREYCLRRIFAGSKKHIEKPFKLGLYISLIFGIFISEIALYLNYDRLFSSEIVLSSQAIKSSFVFASLGLIIFCLICIVINKICIRLLNKKSLVELINHD